MFSVLISQSIHIKEISNSNLAALDKIDEMVEVLKEFLTDYEYQKYAGSDYYCNCCGVGSPNHSKYCLIPKAQKLLKELKS